MTEFPHVCVGGLFVAPYFSESFWKNVKYLVDELLPKNIQKNEKSYGPAKIFDVFQQIMDTYLHLF